MGKLIFKAADARRVAEHSIANEQAEISDWSKASEKNGWTPGRIKPSEPMVALVHDQGVYLLSNGKPRDLISGTQKDGSSFCAYAEGCDPKADSDWYDTAHDLVGGDDFGEYLPWAKQIVEALDQGASHVVVSFNSRSVKLDFRFPKGKGPKAEKREASPEEWMRMVLRQMRHKLFAFDPKSKTLRVFKGATQPPLVEQIKRLHPTYQILNGAPMAEIAKAIDAHIATNRQASGRAA